VHFLARYREERAAGRSAEEAVRITLTQSGQAVLFTSLLLIIGFGVMSFSTLTSTRHFGMLSAVTMTAALAAELLLMPALLHASARLEHRKPPASVAPKG
jgi:predicted RND superfamily exporter protein